MGWVVGIIYGFVMLFLGFYSADDEWVDLINEPDTYECSFLDSKDVCEAKMQLKRELANKTHHQITNEK